MHDGLDSPGVLALAGQHGPGAGDEPAGALEAWAGSGGQSKVACWVVAWWRPALSCNRQVPSPSLLPCPPPPHQLKACIGCPLLQKTAMPAYPWPSKSIQSQRQTRHHKSPSEWSEDFMSEGQ